MPRHPILTRVLRKIRKILPHRPQPTAQTPSGPSYHDSDSLTSKCERNRESSIYSPDAAERTDSISLLHFPIRRRRPSAYHPPTFGDADSLTSLFSRRDTTMLIPPAISEILSQHPAIRDNPPPFARYSAPEPHKNKIEKRGTIVHQQRLEFEQKCINLDEEREQLAAQLEFVTQELADAQQQVENAKEEIAVREGASQELREKCERLTLGIDHTANCLGSTAAELRDLQKEHAGCADREMLLEMRIEGLMDCRFKSRAALKRRIDELQSQIRNLGGLEEKVWSLQVGAETVRVQEERIDDYLQQIRDQESRIEEFEARQKEDAEELGMARTDLYSVCEELAKARNESRRLGSELKQRDLELEHRDEELERQKSDLKVVMLNNRDLELDIYCLKSQHRGVFRRYSVQGNSWPLLCRAKSLMSM